MGLLASFPCFFGFPELQCDFEIRSILLDFFRGFLALRAINVLHDGCHNQGRRRPINGLLVFGFTSIQPFAQAEQCFVPDQKKTGLIHNPTSPLKIFVYVLCWPFINRPAYAITKHRRKIPTYLQTVFFHRHSLTLSPCAQGFSVPHASMSRKKFMNNLGVSGCGGIVRPRPSHLVRVRLMTRPGIECFEEAPDLVRWRCLPGLDMRYDILIILVILRYGFPHLPPADALRQRVEVACFGVPVR